MSFKFTKRNQKDVEPEADKLARLFGPAPAPSTQEDGNGPVRVRKATKQELAR